ncbi:MAG: peptidoglycan DD-metalloendopeptidase family protein [Bacillota bacterium]
MDVSGKSAPSPWSYIRKLMMPPWRGWVRARWPYLASLVLLSLMLGSLVIMERLLPRPAAPETRPPEAAEGTPGGDAPENPPVPGPAVPAGTEVAPEEPLRPVPGRVSRAYGWGFSATLGDYRFHTGVDLEARPGEQVQAAEAGRVTFAGTNDETGLTVIVRHGDGKQALYGNLGTLAVSEGQQVSRGDPLGTAGATNAAESADPPHLHYEVLAGSEPVDPGLR